MQIAGSRCIICDQTVGIVREGTACTACRVIYHTRCVANSLCPSCNQPLLAGKVAHSLPSASDQTELERPTSVTIIGRLTYVGVPLGILIVLFGMGQLAFDVGTGIELMVTGVLLALISAVCGTAFMRGREWVRQVYLWITPVVLGFEIVVGDNGFIQPGFVWWRSIVQLSVYAVTAFALTRPRTKAFFSSSRRRRIITA